MWVGVSIPAHDTMTQTEVSGEIKMQCIDARCCGQRVEKFLFARSRYRASIGHLTLGAHAPQIVFLTYACKLVIKSYVLVSLHVNT